MAIQEIETKSKTKYRVFWINEFGKKDSKVVETKREANALNKKMKAKKSLGLIETESERKFGEYAKEFIEIHTDDLKETTKRNYKQYVSLLNETFENMKLVDMTPSVLDKYFLYLKKTKKLKMNTIKKYRDILKLILKDARKKHIIKYNPVDDLAFKFTSIEAEINKVVSFEDMRKMIDSFEMVYYKYFIRLGFYTGMRKGEILALTWDMIDYEKRLIYINWNMGSKGNITTPKTSKSIRSIYIHDALFELLHEIKYHQDEMKRFFGNDYIRYKLVKMDENKFSFKLIPTVRTENYFNLVLTKDNGEYLNSHTVSRTFTDKKKIYGTNLTPHNLRHTFASLLVENKNQKDVQELLGHENKEMTNHYQHHTTYSDNTKEEMNNIFKGTN